MQTFIPGSSCPASSCIRSRDWADLRKPFDWKRCKQRARTIRPQRIAVAADDAKEATQRQNSVGVDLETLKTKSLERKMYRHCFSSPEPKAELEERKNLVVFSLKSCAKKTTSFRKSKGFLVKCSRGPKCTGIQLTCHMYI